MKDLGRGVVLEAFDLPEHWDVARREIEIDFPRTFSRELRQFVIGDALEKSFGDVRRDEIPAPEDCFTDQGFLRASRTGARLAVDVSSFTVFETANCKSGPDGFLFCRRSFSRMASTADLVNNCCGELFHLELDDPPCVNHLSSSFSWSPAETLVV